MKRLKEIGIEVISGAVLAPFVIYNAFTDNTPKPTVWQWIGVGIFVLSGVQIAGRT